MYNLFISHSWSYPNQYKNLVALLDANPNFDYKNYSVPKDDPIHNAPNQALLEDAIRRKMQPASCVIILAGVYATYSKWINIEIKLAKSINKKIIAVEPWGSTKTSLTVKMAADEVVGWNTNSVIKAIRGW